MIRYFLQSAHLVHVFAVWLTNRGPVWRRFTVLWQRSFSLGLAGESPDYLAAETARPSHQSLDERATTVNFTMLSCLRLLATLSQTVN